MTGMQTYGSLAPLVRRLQRASESIKPVIERAAFRLERTIVLHIQNQDLPWEALSPKYLARKIKEGFSELIMIRTGTALETVRTIQLDDSSYFVGWPRGVTRKTADGTVEIYPIMAVKEFGSLDGTEPARPVIQPSLKELKVWLRQQMVDELKKAFVS